MRVTVVHSSYRSENPSGENVAVAQQVAALERAGIQVNLVTASTDALAASQRMYGLRAAMRTATGWPGKTLSQVLRTEPDIIHVHNLFPNYGQNWVTGIRSTPLFVTIHNYRPICAAGTLFRDGGHCVECISHSTYRAVKYACYRNSRGATIPLAIGNRKGVDSPLLSAANRVIFLSQRSADDYARAGFAPERGHVITNFVEPVREVNVERGDSWLFVGRLTAEKGVVALVENWPREAGRLDVIGVGPEENRLHKIAGENVAILGSRTRTEVLDHMRKAKGLIVPSLWAEGMPLTYIEALAVGTPVIAFAGNVVADDIQVSESGKVFTEWDGLRECISEVNESHPRYSTAARARYAANFTEEAWCQKMIALYREEIESGRAS